MNDIFEKLSAPFPPDRVSWRIGSTNGDKTKGLALAYIDARDVMQRLDDVVGPDRWQNRYPHANGKTVCEIGILIHPGILPGEWVWKSDGAGDSDVEAEKGALSDAFKRAAVRWGIGRYLYEIASPWVAIEQRGRSYVIVDSEYPKLERLLAGNAEVAGKKTYIALARSIIDASANPKDLGYWWNSEEEKSNRRKYALDESEINELKNAVIAKRDALTGKAAA